MIFMTCLNIEGRRKRGYLGNALRLARDSKWRHWFHIALASLIYILAHIADYSFTVYGIANSEVQEANPIVRGYMNTFGIRPGLAICKSFMCAIIILGVIATRIGYRRKGTEFRVEFFLYLGSFITLLGGVLWLTKL
jgi:hypothetical protein